MIVSLAEDRYISSKYIYQEPERSWSLRGVTPSLECSDLICGVYTQTGSVLPGQTGVTLHHHPISFSVDTSAVDHLAFRHGLNTILANGQ